MRNFIIAIVVAGFAVTSGVTSRGLSQWGANGCPPVGGNALIHLYQPAVAQKFPLAPEPPEVPNYGLANREGPRFARLPRYSYNSQQVEKAEAHRLVMGVPGVPDDSKLPWLVSVSKTPEDKLKVKALLSSMQTKFRVQNYLEGEWYTRDRGGATVFTSGLTVCTPGGGQCAHYASAEEAMSDLMKLPDGFDPLDLLNLLKRIRNPIPPPSPPPSPTPEPAPLPNTVTIPLWAILGGLLVAWMIFGGAKK